MSEDRFIWNSEPDRDGKTGFTAHFSIGESPRAYSGRAAASKNDQTILAARWICLMVELRRNSRSMTEALAREAWFASIGIPKPEERGTVDRAREIVVKHIGADALAKIYKTAA